MFSLEMLCVVAVATYIAHVREHHTPRGGIILCAVNLYAFHVSGNCYSRDISYAFDTCCVYVLV